MTNEEGRTPGGLSLSTKEAEGRAFVNIFYGLRSHKPAVATARGLPTRVGSLESMPWSSQGSGKPFGTKIAP
jgi:hypothetical protein